MLTSSEGLQELVKMSSAHGRMKRGRSLKVLRKAICVVLVWLRRRQKMVSVRRAEVHLRAPAVPSISNIYVFVLV